MRPPIPQRSHVTVARRGREISVYINGVRIGSATDPDPIPATGRVGLAAIWDMVAAFGNVVVRTP